MKKILKSTLLLTITFACLTLSTSVTEAKYNPHYGELTGWGNTRSGQTTISRNPDNARLKITVEVKNPNDIGKFLSSTSGYGVLAYTASSPWMYIRSIYTPYALVDGAVKIYTSHTVMDGSTHLSDVEYYEFVQN